ncbi:hypothetical protein AGMMS50293_00180 [Spirochaetia bacterium]|nr:hypothetical protein AGMMS50293_00180 [Spirochaetia bacterium]
MLIFQGTAYSHKNNGKADGLFDQILKAIGNSPDQETACQRTHNDNQGVNDWA